MLYNHLVAETQQSVAKLCGVPADKACSAFKEDVKEWIYHEWFTAKKDKGAAAPRGHRQTSGGKEKSGQKRIEIQKKRDNRQHCYRFGCDFPYCFQLKPAL
jgi:hypothetical protein